jgi:hypothetical protein
MNCQLNKNSVSKQEEKKQRSRSGSSKDNRVPKGRRSLPIDTIPYHEVINTKHFRHHPGILEALEMQ